MTDINSVGVIVPAHNEESLLPGCLAALRVAVRFASLPVRVVVVLDDCTDTTGDVCQRFGVESFRIAAHNVGEARGAGARRLLRNESRPEAVWLASTDADTRVPPTWLRDQVDLAQSGADVVLGVVRLGDDDAAPSLLRAFEFEYQKQLADNGSHSHIHGANLGVRASVYLRAGGFPPVPNHEDRRLIQQLHRLRGVTIETCQNVGVQTSSRIEGRCDHGFAATLGRFTTSLERPSSPPRAGRDPQLAR